VAVVVVAPPIHEIERAIQRRNVIRLGRCLLIEGHTGHGLDETAQRLHRSLIADSMDHDDSLPRCEVRHDEFLREGHVTATNMCQLISRGGLWTAAASRQHDEDISQRGGEIQEQFVVTTNRKPSSATGQSNS
jgi:hypothetical protein